LITELTVETRSDVVIRVARVAVTIDENALTTVHQRRFQCNEVSFVQAETTSRVRHCRCIRTTADAADDSVVRFLFFAANATATAAATIVGGVCDGGGCVSAVLVPRRQPLV
jgi:hypothetical protein